MIQKIINFIKSLFCKAESISAKAVVVKPSEEKQESIDKKKNLEKLAKAVNKKKKYVE